MNDNARSQSLAAEGIQQIENAVIELLNRNPQGLRNMQIANMLGLSSGVRGGHRNYLTYSVLGNLLDQGRILWDAETKLYTTVGADSTPQSLAGDGLRQIEQAILDLLHQNPQGLRNVDVAATLSLYSTVRGGRRNYLTYSVLGGLIAKGKVAWDQQTKLYTKNP